MDHVQHQYSNTVSTGINQSKYQLSTQYPNSQHSPPQQQSVPLTILSLLKDKKIQLGDYTNSWGENGDWLLRGLVVCINTLLSINDQYPNNFSQFLPEHMKLPMITIEGYIGRIIKYSPCSKECFITILMYIDRLIQNRHFIVNSYNIHRILITCVLVAAKYLDDIFYNNQFYSQVGGVSVKEINIMELDLLKLLSYDVSIPLRTYQTYVTSFERYVKQIQLTLKYPVNLKGLPSHIPNIDVIEMEILNSNNSINNINSNSTLNQQQHSSSTNSTKKQPGGAQDQTPMSIDEEDVNNKSNPNQKQNFNNTSTEVSQKPIYQVPTQSFRFQPQPNCVA
ncbi:Non-receptor tyrosine kinase spore lysis A [Tieghemostelium lacteum]|uniref:Non-receptor tyrosine kinase spore lysis A n=1 Tax=Tieghemostelium lacteum TaxID=361077 RepID=A0A151ZS69_TIELA|nr:Non-receptor tyrosine kinase spore lysis A [Tieghemostelium lacteum]|eukprot:KYQ96827.1 Non-receptor tyrosine kinase spore lysis A [Tieghemostelium lacteum]